MDAGSGGIEFVGGPSGGGDVVGYRTFVMTDQIRSIDSSVKFASDVILPIRIRNGLTIS
jgi:hypothetical protein